MWKSSAQSAAGRRVYIEGAASLTLLAALLGVPIVGPGCAPPPEETLRTTLRVFVQGDGDGRVTQIGTTSGVDPTPQQINCAGNGDPLDVCRLDYETVLEKSVVLTATADAQSVFAGWTTGGGEPNPSATITVRVVAGTDVAVTATFHPKIPGGCTSDASCTEKCAAQCEGPAQNATCNLTAQSCVCVCPSPPDASDASTEMPLDAADPGPEIPEEIGPDADTGGPDADTVDPDCDRTGFISASQTFVHSVFSGESRYEARSESSPVGRLRLEFKDSSLVSPGVYPIASGPLNQDPATCTICARIDLGCGETGCDVSFFGTGGTITVTELNLNAGIFVGTLTDATFQAITTDPEELVPEGEVWCVDSYDFGVSPECVPDCGGGGSHELCNVPDGCGDTCNCLDTHTCNFETGLCESNCTPNCTGACGVDDGCDGVCGCAGSETCNLETNTCEPCAPSCDGGCDVADGCGGMCVCAGTDHCNQETKQCEPCVPSCGAACDIDDGCGGTCACAASDTCDEATNLCVACVPACTDGECGNPNQCGGICGCEAGEGCEGGICIATPGAPTGVVATAGDEQVELSWSPLSGVTFNVYFGFTAALTPQTGAPIIGATSPWIVHGLAPGLPVWFVVTAVNAAGEGPPSAAVMAEPFELDKTAPTVVFHTPEGGGLGVDPATAIRVGFSEPLADGTLASGFVVTLEGQAVSGAWGQTGSTATFTPTTALEHSAEYVVTLSTALTDVAGNPLAAEQAFSFTTRPEAPAAANAIGGNGAVTLRWGGVPGATGYAIHRRGEADLAHTTMGGTLRPSYTDRTASNGTTYYYVVTAFTADGESGPSVELTGTPSDLAMTTPANVTTLPGDGDALILWDSSCTGCTYTLRRADSPSAEPVVVVTGLTRVTHRVTGLANGTRYHYVVQAHGAGPDSAWSSEADVIPSDDLLPTPTGLSAEVGSGWAELTWTPVVGAVSYQIYATTEPEQRPTMLTGATENSAVLGLVDDSNYRLSVVALDARGVASAPSEELAVAPAATLAPRPAVLLLAYPTAHGTIHLEWTSALGATGYRLMRSDGSPDGFQHLADVGGTSYDDAGLAEGLYEYLLEATSNGGTVSAEDSNTLSATAIVGPDEPPGGVAAQAGDGCVTVSWDPVPGASDYYVYMATAPGGPYGPTSVSTALFDTSGTICGLANETPGEPSVETPLYFIVQAWSALYGYSDDSAEVSATPLSTLPEAPVPSGVFGDSEVVLHWEAVAGATSYHVYRRSEHTPWEELAETTDPTQLIYRDATVTNGTTWYYTVQSAEGEVRGARSQQVVAGTPGAGHGATPTGLTARAGNGCVTVSWEVTPGATYYELRGATEQGGPYAVVAVTSEPFANAATLCELQNETTYHYIVQAWNGVQGYSGYSAPLSVEPLPTLPPSTTPAAMEGNGRVSLTWPTAGPEGTTYHIYRRTNRSAWQVIGDTQTLRYLDEEAANGTTYYYAVQAETGGAFGALSLTFAAALPSAERPVAPTGLTAHPGPDCVTLRWDASPGSAWYSVHGATPIGAPYTNLTGFYGGFANAYTACGLGNVVISEFAVESWTGIHGYSGLSSVVTAAGSSSRPERPDSLTATPSNAQVDLTWPVGLGAQSYHIYRRTELTPWRELVETEDLRFSDRNLLNGTTYTYAVQSEGSDGRGAWREGGQGLPAETYPAAPRGIVAESGNGCISLSWEVVPGATYYYVHDATLADSIPTVGATNVGLDNRFTICELANGIPYTFVVRSWSPGGGFSGYSTPVTGVPNEALPLTPGAPTLAEGAAGSLQLQWAAVPGAAGYSVHRRTDTTPWALVRQSVAPSALQAGLASGTVYTYAIQAFSADGAASALGPDASLAAP
jgi:fibronectin type 3 domain-containing protein